MLRSASLSIIRKLGVEGGCNVQFALDTKSTDYIVIEVNPRVSRSSALASKATGYPIAKVATKIAIGYRLDEIQNTVTGKTKACFEPAIDYVVLKFPRWPFDKFVGADRELSTQMKATGEVMAIDRTFEAALLKAVRSLEIKAHRLQLPAIAALTDELVLARLSRTDDERLFVVAEALRRGIDPAEISRITTIDPFFIDKIQRIVAMELRVVNEPMTPQLMRAAKRCGLADRTIAELTLTPESEVRSRRKRWNIIPCYKMVDTCAAEFEAVTPYYYSTYAQEDEVQVTNRRKVLVLGSGPIRIGQGIEFDYCSVHSVWALREMGIESIIINNNPETVSTDFDTSDRLYFEPLTMEDVMNVIEKEMPEGVIVQFGGQTAINLAGPLSRAGVQIMGSSLESIDTAEDREKFDAFLESLYIPRPKGASVTDAGAAIAAANRIGYPVVVRPSYVLGGRAMEIVYNEGDLRYYLTHAVQASPDRPVLVDRYMQGTEVEVDAVSDGNDVLIPGIMEHIERAGVHSGDSIAVYPPITLSEEIRNTVVDYTVRMARALKVKGIITVQYGVHENKLYVIEVNPRSSRTVPFLSKVTKVPMINLATRAAMGQSLASLGYSTGLLDPVDYTAVKAPVFSFAKITQVDIALGPEMKSTGEVIGIDYHFERALYKAIIASGIQIPDEGAILLTIADKDKQEALEIARGYAELGYPLVATEGTAKMFSDAGLKVESVRKVSEGSPHILDLIKSGVIRMVISTLTTGKLPEADGFKIRRSTVEHAIPCLTSLDTAKAVLDVLTVTRRRRLIYSMAMQDYAGNNRPVRELN